MQPLLIPAEDTLFLPFASGAVLFRPSTRKLSVINNTAAVIWCYLAEKKAKTEIVLALMEMFAVSHNKAVFDVDTAINSFHDAGMIINKAEPQSFNPTADHLRNKKITTPFVAPKGATRCFQAPGFKFFFVEENYRFGKLLEAIFPPPQQAEGIPQHVLFLAVSFCPGHADKWNIYADGELIFTAIEEESVLPHLLTLIFEHGTKTKTDYLLFHAAVLLQKGDGALVLPAHSGSGKTTIAAMLAGKGWQLFSDELAVVDVKTLSFSPFLMPLSIKNGALNLHEADYPELKDTIVHYRPDGKVVRYVHPRPHSVPECGATAMAKRIVFPKFRKKGGTTLQCLTKEEALQNLVVTCSSDRLLREEDLRAILKMVEQTPCYALHYANATTALSLLIDNYSQEF